MEEIIKILRNRHWTIGTMESCTGGAIANCITNIPGSSDVFEIGKVTYSIKAKIEAGVDKEIIKQYGVFSKETAEEMARKIDPPKAGAFRRAGVGVGVTGNFNFPGEVFVAMKIGDQIKSIKLKVKSMSKSKIEARKEMKERVVEKVVEMILDNI